MSEGWDFTIAVGQEHSQDSTVHRTDSILLCGQFREQAKRRK